METLIEFLKAVPAGFFFAIGAVLTIIIAGVRLSKRAIQRKKLKNTMQKNTRKAERDRQKILAQEAQDALQQTRHILSEIQEYSQNLQNIALYPLFHELTNPSTQHLHSTVDEVSCEIQKVDEEFLSGTARKKRYTAEDMQQLQHVKTAPVELKEAFRDLKLEAETVGWNTADKDDMETLQEAADAIQSMIANKGANRKLLAETIYLNMDKLFQKYHFPAAAKHFFDVFRAYVEQHISPEFYNALGQSFHTVNMSDAELTTMVDKIAANWGELPQRPVERIDQLLAQLQTYWKQHPDMRLGQIVGNMAAGLDIDSYYLEDDKLLELLKQENE